MSNLDVFVSIAFSSIMIIVGGIHNAVEDWYVGPLPEVHCTGNDHSHWSGGGCYGSGTQRRRARTMEKEGYVKKCHGKSFIAAMAT